MPHRNRFRHRLGVRLVLFLSLALIPVGLLAVLQTQEVIRRMNAQSEAQLADRTRSAARNVREAVLWAIGAANGLGPLVTTSTADEPACIRRLETFVQSRSGVIAAGVVQPDGKMTCSSNGTTADFSDNPNWQDMVSDPRTIVSYTPMGAVSHAPVIVASVPYFDHGRFEGVVFVSQAHERLQTNTDQTPGATFKTFNTDGNVLTTTDSDSSYSQLLPRDRSLSDLARDHEITFTGTSRGGETKVYSVAPIVDGTVYAIGIWTPDYSSGGWFGLAAIPVFPILMWMMSLVVAYFAVDRLALRHIRRLRLDMRRFAASRRVPAEADTDMAAEIYEIFDAFHAMTETVVRDEAELEQLLHDKNVLLKEVHHRVKNNLQLISSIMNMQMRQISSSEAKNALRRLQSRVLSLATIHRTLYKTENLGAVQAGPLLEQIVNQLTALAAAETQARIETRFDPVTLYPDQAVPVSLLTTEAVTNALKYAGTVPDKAGWLTVSLTDMGDGTVLLAVENSKGPDHLLPAEERIGSGLGTGLIRAFATQLDARAEVQETADAYRLSCRFQLQGFTAPEDTQPVQPGLAAAMRHGG